jgi:arsenite methyltransferase
MTVNDAERLRSQVREHYAKAAHDATASCCGDPATDVDTFGRSSYDAATQRDLPETALVASLGCGNPTALADLRAGDVVLDLGSGGGIDVLLAARRVGPTGKAYGLDMTPEMLDLAKRNQAEAGVINVEFLLGTIEEIPLADESVDVIISNCVVNLAADKRQVFTEAFRVLRPGGRLAISDILLRRPLPARLTDLIALWTSCVAGALPEAACRDYLRAAGFENVDIEPRNVLTRIDLQSLAEQLNSVPPSLSPDDIASAVAELDGVVMSAFIRARRPSLPTA